ncbi:hypothetical protein LPJ78_005326 [Coemansia sp. RSA 989]|nr:hypothetical protein BX667DRAFT_54508 [Coemansia mojavensis]KAJ1738932.1 hypothetical protein LPJ68_005119 [Coemansia sp. RSA 1086]KAJ1747395.1 hypothetical protein LPJ79_005273 [Coemansia sp. RSA 1821]KAJ1861453.1 hypothetical protein LPJ78_005326 [Coemansia sp. RSA 989]KAJ1870057.1 hypothetical protein LPJ55_004941 [Coemansia sp. RSA 990]KAJ2647622.1 hypothetical protein IWW40_004524 [Coemansia sp. RSA 1250]KAJ2669558.1 hypothetical protein IWW42_004510 [Coemansia sp. RSA 1085]
MDLIERQSKIEQLAEDIITDQQLEVDYSRKLQENREALRRLREQQQKIKANSRLATSTVNMGDFFIVVPTAKAHEMVDSAQKELEGAIEGVQQRLKNKVELLGKLEGRL